MSLILIVEDNEKNLQLVRDVLQVKGFSTLEAGTAEDGITLARERKPDLILMDIHLPGMSGIEALKVLRGEAATAAIPVIAVTASVMQQDRKQITAAGFDADVGKPINQPELFARVRSLLRVKALQDEVARQADALKQWNLKLEERVNEQVAELQRLGQLKRFFSPHVADAIVTAGEKSILAPHRREICYVFTDLRGFTAFTDASEPEEVEAVLREYHSEMGAIITRHEGTIDRFAGDGILIFFNDPLPLPDAAPRAALTALEMQAAVAPLRQRWV